MSSLNRIDQVRRPQTAADPFPTPPITSSRALGWEGLVVERYHYPGAEYKIPPLAMHTLVLQLGQPLHMSQRRDGKTHHGAFLTHQLALIPAGLPNHCWHTDSVDAVFLTLDPQFVARTAEAAGADSRRVEVINNFGARDPQLQSLTLSFLQEAQAPGLGGRLYVESLANQLAIHLLRYYAMAVHPWPDLLVGPGLAPAPLQQVLAFINDQLDQDLSLAAMAAVVHLSPYHFARLFKQSVGQSPHQYVIRQRVEAAKRLLASGLPTAQVAAEAGFADYSHLARHFKRLVGLPPSEFQRRKNLHS